MKTTDAFYYKHLLTTINTIICSLIIKNVVDNSDKKLIKLYFKRAEKRQTLFIQIKKFIFKVTNQGRY